MYRWSVVRAGSCETREDSEHGFSYNQGGPFAAHQMESAELFVYQGEQQAEGLYSAQMRAVLIFLPFLFSSNLSAQPPSIEILLQRSYLGDYYSMESALGNMSVVFVQDRRGKGNERRS